MHVDDIGFEYSSTLENVELDGRTLDAVDNLGQSGYVRAADALFGLARILSAILDNVYTFDGIDEKNTVGRKSVTHRLEVWNRKTDISQFLDRETETVEHGSGKKMPSVLVSLWRNRICQRVANRTRKQCIITSAPCFIDLKLTIIMAKTKYYQMHS